MTATGRVTLFRRKPFDMAEMPVPAPRPGAALVRVRITNNLRVGPACMARRLPARWPRRQAATVLGHEMTGMIAALGRDVDRDSHGEPLHEDDHVIVAYFTGCGHCPSCQRGRRAACDHIDKAMTGDATEWPHFVGEFERNRDKLTLGQLISAKLPLDQINEAFAQADRRAVLRASLVP